MSVQGRHAGVDEPPTLCLFGGRDPQQHPNIPGLQRRS
jgi:hypothetical protein